LSILNLKKKGENFYNYSSRLFEWLCSGNALLLNKMKETHYHKLRSQIVYVDISVQNKGLERIGRKDGTYFTHYANWSRNFLYEILSFSIWHL